MDFNLELKKLRSYRRDCLDARNRLDIYEEEEISKTTKQIRDKYSSLRDENNKEFAQYDKDMLSYLKQIETCSKFVPELICETISSIIRIFEGENYLYQRVALINEREDIYSNKSEANIKLCNMVIAALNISHLYFYKEIEQLEKKGRILLLSNGHCTPFKKEKAISFYRVYDGENFPTQCVDFSRFPYVKEFIDEVISYKIENGLKISITKEELDRLKADFITSHLDQIQRNYDLLDQDREIKLDEDKIHRQYVLNRAINKINHNKN